MPKANFQVLAWNYVQKTWINSTSLLATMLSRFKAWLSGFDLGPHCQFYGLPTFRAAASASVRIGEYCVFRSGATSNLIGIDRPCILSAHDASVLKIGAHCGFSGTVIGCFKEIIIGNKVRCGANTTITDSDWHQDDPRSGPPKPVVIEDNVWIGAGSTILKGVTIGRNSVIGAGSVVTRSIPANVVAAGNPCQIIKEIKCASE